MKHPTASADLAGAQGPLASDFMTGLRLSTNGAMDGDALTGLVRDRIKRPPTRMVPSPSDPRKPWTEPTVTECATTNRRPATLTIAGVDLPNPPARPDIAKLLRFLEKDAEFIGSEKFWNNDSGSKCMGGKVYADDYRAAIAEIQRQAAEITELQGMIEDAIGPVRLVSELANMTDFECRLQRVSGIRDAARNKLDGDFAMPQLYGDEDRKRAVADLLSLPEMRSGDTETMSAALCGDTVAGALGLRRAGQ